MPHLTQSRSFQRRSSQPITWLILTNKTVQENTQTKYNSKYNYRGSAKKRDGFILQCSRAHMGL